MCGIFGYVGSRSDSPQVVLAGLKKLEYRGYDSWGIAARHNGAGAGSIAVEKHVGKIGQASTLLADSKAALGHTRWATHGGVTEVNAHPHLDCGGELAVIHNGIIENYEELRSGLRQRGHRFVSETDTEVVAHLLEEELVDKPRDADHLIEALIVVFRGLDGLSAISVLEPSAQCIAVAKNGSPLVLGHGSDGNFLASDSTALLEHTRRLTFLDDGQAALITPDDVRVYDIASGLAQAQTRIWDIAWVEERTDLSGFPNFMSKEIHEQPSVLRRLAEQRASEAA
ncbi:MAG: class II glutamine amidotransferase, partial [Chloroflexi bacterium]|nr:class II glutamine amidotransferase [Chloroflexota bacterium]